MSCPRTAILCLLLFSVFILLPPSAFPMTALFNAPSARTLFFVHQSSYDDFLNKHTQVLHRRHPRYTIEIRRECVVYRPAALSTEHEPSNYLNPVVVAIDEEREQEEFHFHSSPSL